MAKLWNSNNVEKGGFDVWKLEQVDFVRDTSTQRLFIASKNFIFVDLSLVASVAMINNLVKSIPGIYTRL